MKKFLFIFALFVGLPCFAQYVEYTYKNDKSKTMQVKSLEGGYWNFHPGWYYVTLHKDYSGGRGFFKISFEESKSKEGWVSKQRVLSEAQEMLTDKHIQHEIDSIDPLVKEERKRYAERIVDTAYPVYKDELNDNFKVIDNLIQGLISKGMSQLTASITRLTEDAELLRSEVDYIHKDARNGAGHEMEQTKRELAYEDVIKRQQQLIQSATGVLRYALAHEKK